MKLRGQIEGKVGTLISFLKSGIQTYILEKWQSGNRGLHVLFKGNPQQAKYYNIIKHSTHGGNGLKELEEGCGCSY